MPGIEVELKKFFMPVAWKVLGYDDKKTTDEFIQMYKHNVLFHNAVNYLTSEVVHIIKCGEMANKNYVCKSCGNKEKDVDSTGLCGACRREEYEQESQQDDFD